MVQILNLDRLKEKLRKRLEQSRHAPEDDAVTGYTAGYSIYVHEDLSAHHEVGQAKFLEEPARELANNGVFAANAKEQLQKGRTLGEALLMNALLLQRTSQSLVPIDTGNLRASAFSDYVKNLSSAVDAAKTRGEAARQEWLGRAAKMAEHKKISIFQALRIMRKQRIAKIKAAEAKRGSRS